VTVANGSTVLDTDLTALTTTQLGLLQVDNAQLPGAVAQHFHFPNLVASTAAIRSKAIIIVPFDCYLETLSVEACDHTAASTTTVQLVGDGGVSLWPVSITGTTGAGTTKLARLLFDNGKTTSKRGLFPTVSRAHRTLLKGSTVTLTVSTTNIATPSQVHVALVMRAIYARE
jgi:hypothetical protein